jgi:type I restriction enzyme R subunit
MSADGRAASARGASGLQFFDPAAEYAVTGGRLPHWQQAGTVAFITFRTWDSMPREVLDRWAAERADWMTRRLPGWERVEWQAAQDRLTPADRTTLLRLTASRWNDDLDRCHGACPLRRPECSRTVADSLAHFDGDRYALFDYVIMPNHVHVLAAFPEPGAMRKQCESWKHFTARNLNRMLGRSGRFWEEDCFDHLVRSAEQFGHFRRYIAENPVRAGLREGEYRHYSRSWDEITVS